MKNYELKKEIIEKHYDLLALNRKMHWYMHINNFEKSNEIFDMHFENLDFKIYREIEKLNNNYYKRKSKLRKKIDSMLSIGPCIFVTMTFRDEIFKNTSIETRRRYISRFLASVSEYYIANIDYGSINEREHYHAIVLSDFISYADYKYGIINFKKININDKSSAAKLSKYVLKLSNHSLKYSNKTNYCIYSKKQNM